MSHKHTPSEPLQPADDLETGSHSGPGGTTEKPHDLDLCEDFIENLGLGSAQQLLEAQMTIVSQLLMKNAKNHKLKYNPLNRLHKLVAYMWIAILIDLLDKKIDLSSFKHDGPRNGTERIERTEKFFTPLIFGGKSKKHLQRHVDFVNLMHEQAGVVTEEDGSPDVTPYYQASFTFVIGSLSEMMHRFFEREMDGANMKNIDKALHDIWYKAAGQLAGATKIPVDPAAHRAFYEDMKARVTQRLEGDEKGRDMAKCIALSFIPKIADISKDSEQDIIKLIEELEPDLFRLLDLSNTELPKEFQRYLTTTKPEILKSYVKFHKLHANGWSPERPHVPDLGVAILKGIGKGISRKVRSLFVKKEKPDPRAAMLDEMWNSIDPNRDVEPEQTSSLLHWGIGKVRSSIQQMFGDRKTKTEPIPEEITPQQTGGRDPFARTLFHIVNQDPKLCEEQKIAITTVTLEPGKALTTFDEDPKKMFVIYSTDGSLEVCRPDQFGEEEVHATVTNGHAVTIGEISMQKRFSNGKGPIAATATVRAGKEGATLRLIELTPGQYGALLESGHARWVRHAIKTTIQRRLKLYENKKLVGRMEAVVEALLEDRDEGGLRELIQELEQHTAETEDEAQRKHLEQLINDLQLYAKLTEQEAADKKKR
jgi:hypothetical protein